MEAVELKNLVFSLGPELKHFLVIWFLFIGSSSFCPETLPLFNLQKFQICYSIKTVDRINSFKLVNIKNIKVMK